jgi:hypothetical protein
MVTMAAKLATATAIRIKMCLHQKDFNLRKKVVIIKLNLLQTKKYYFQMSVFLSLLLAVGWFVHFPRRKVIKKLIKKRFHQKDFHLLAKLISQKDLMRIVIYYQRG